MVRKRRTLKWAAIVIVGTVVAAYIALLGAELHSARQAADLLDAMEKLRVDDPAVKLRQALQDCTIERSGHEFSCVITAGAFRVEWPWELLWKLPDEDALRISMALSHAGLRWWRLGGSGSISENKIQEASISLMLIGKRESLGARWRIGKEIPAAAYLKLTEDQKRTFISGFHITSIPGGEGWTVDATPSSTEEELRARWINRACLFSFRGCEIGDLLPEVPAVVQGRRMNLK